MKKLKLFEEFNIAEEPKLGEILICQIKNNNKVIFIIKIISDSTKSKVYSNSFKFDTIDLSEKYNAEIYYNYIDKYLFYASRINCKLLFRTFNEEEGLERFEIIKDTNKFNI